MRIAEPRVLVDEILESNQLCADARRDEGARDGDEVGADLRPDHAKILIEVIAFHHHGQARHVVIEKRRHTQNVSRGVVHEKAVVPRMAVNIGHDRIHHNHFAEALLGVVLRAEFQHVAHAERAVEEPMSRHIACLFRCEQGAFARELLMESHDRVRDMVDLRGFETGVGIAFRASFKQVDAVFVAVVAVVAAFVAGVFASFADPTFRERAGCREFGRCRRVLATVHSRAVESDARDDIVERVAVERHRIPGKVFVGPFHPERIGQRQAAYRADEIVARVQPEFAHELLDRSAVLGNLSAIDPIIDAGETIGQIRVVLLDERIAVVVEIFDLFIGGRDHVFVHKLVKHAAAPLVRPRPLYVIAKACFAIRPRRFPVAYGLRCKSRNRRYVDPVGTAESVIAQPLQDRQERWWLPSGATDLLRKAEQVGSRFFHLVMADFHFDARPGAISGLYDSVHFQVISIPVEINVAALCLRIDKQVAHAQRLKQKPEGFEIAEQLLWRQF